MIGFPKPKKEKKRQKHKRSILQEKDGRCYLCMRLNHDYRFHRNIETHHVYGGPNRSISEAEGFTVYLCHAHHTGSSAAVHNNHENMRYVQRNMQRHYELSHSREEFMELIGRNFRDE